MNAQEILDQVESESWKAREIIEYFYRREFNNLNKHGGKNGKNRYMGSVRE